MDHDQEIKHQEQETRQQGEEEAEMWFEGWDINVRPELDPLGG